VTLKLIGAGLGRTGTTSLKAALELLLGGPCYHMDEAFEHPEHVEVWRAALRGDDADLCGVMSGYAACVDWPSGACWRELLELYPEALVLLSERESAEEWWRSADATIFRKMREATRPDDPLAVSSGMIEEMMRLRFSPNWNAREEALAAYGAWNASVRELTPPAKLIEWRPGDGWAPLCAALNLSIPKVPFPHKNTAVEFRKNYGWS
jgi:Sulfotransferase domain